MNATIEMLLDVGDGLFTRASAKVAGVSDFELSLAVREGQVRRWTRGVYGRSMDEGSEGVRRLVQEHRILARAALLLHPDGVLAGHSAVVAHGLPTLDSALGKVRLQRDVPQQVSTADFVIRPGELEPVETPIGPAVPVDWAVIQTTLDHGVAHGAVVADAVLRDGRLTIADLKEWPARVAGWPHSSRVSSLRHFVDSGSESPGETLTRVHLQMAGLELESQVRVTDPSTGEVFARVDLVVKGTKVAIEFDGQVKYTDGGSAALFAEKQREDRLRALGYVIVRVVWSDLFVAGRVVARVRRAVAQAA
jgi:hypothetical protein